MVAHITQRAIRIMQDNRKPEDYIFNYYLGVAAEDIVKVLINRADMVCERNGSDKEYFNPCKLASCKGDLLINDDILVDIKTSRFFDEKDFNMKAYQIEKYKQQDLDIILVDYETHPGVLYFAWFNIKDIDKNLSPDSFIQKGKNGEKDKEWKKVSLIGEDIHCINFKKIPIKGKIVDNVFNVKDKDNSIFVETSDLATSIRKHNKRISSVKI